MSTSPIMQRNPMNAVRSLLLPLVCATLLAACGKHQGSPSRQDQESKSPVLIPFAVGKAWSYDFAAFDSLGNKLSSQPTRTVVTRDTLVGAERWYALQDDAVRDEGQPPSYAANRADGVYLFGRQGEGSLLYKYPAVRGDECPPLIVASTDTLIRCPAGEFRCYLYESVSTYTPVPHRSFTVVTRDFIAPGTGLVRHEATTTWTDTETGKTTPGPFDITSLTMDK